MMWKVTSEEYWFDQWMEGVLEPDEPLLYGCEVCGEHYQVHSGSTLTCPACGSLDVVLEDQAVIA